jgi:hypothetical protein
MLRIEPDCPRVVAGAFGRPTEASDFEKVLDEIQALGERYESADSANDYGVAEMYLELLRSAVERRDAMMYGYGYHS